MASLEDFLEDLFDRRGPSTMGGNPHRFVELFGGEIVSFSITEPDPQTFRGAYYYNTRQNRLFKKVTVGQAPFWKRISEIQR